jgi:hypothetical protein
MPNALAAAVGAAAGQNPRASAVARRTRRRTPPGSRVRCPEIPDPPADGALGAAQLRGDFPVTGPAGNAQLHGVRHHRGRIGPPDGQHRRQQDMGGVALAAAYPARRGPAVHRRHLAPDDPLPPEPPRLQRSTAPGTGKLAGEELEFDSGRIVAYRRHSATRFASGRPGAALETETGSFVR